MNEIDLIIAAHRREQARNAVAFLVATAIIAVLATCAIVTLVWLASELWS